MLVLSRRKGERIHIGEDIVLTVIDSRNGQVRLGFEAPEDVTILREEVSEPLSPRSAAKAASQVQ